MSGARRTNAEGTARPRGCGSGALAVPKSGGHTSVRATLRARARACSTPSRGVGLGRRERPLLVFPRAVGLSSDRLFALGGGAYSAGGRRGRLSIRARRQSDPVNLPFESAAFNAVASIGVLEHVRENGGDEVASLNEIRRVLRPGGVFVCYHFPNRYSWVDAVARLLPGEAHHTYRYTRTDVQRIVALAGLDLIETGTYALLPRNPLHRLPARVVDSERFARAYNAADRVLGGLFRVLCTNHYFVARKGEALSL